jgi:RNA polymerase sigma factor (sigma-70 family)
MLNLAIQGFLYKLTTHRQPSFVLHVIVTAKAMSETELLNHIEGCKRQDRLSQKWLFDRYYRLMFGICLRYASDQDAVQDIVQEGFLKVFNNIEGYTSKGSFEGWMRRIMVNTAIDAIRRNKASGWILADEHSMDLLANEAVIEEDEDTELAFTVHDVLQAMERLSPVYRTVFNLAVFENMGHQEIANQLGISVGASKSNLAKARRNVRSILIGESSV